MDAKGWGDGNISVNDVLNNPKKYKDDYNRINKANLKYPIIMDIKGNIKTKKDEMGKACYEMMKTQYTKYYSEMLNIFFGIHVSVLTPVPSKDMPDNSEYSN